MADSFELILKSLLDQAEATRAKLDSLNSTSFDKADFLSFQGRLDKQFDDFTMNLKMMKSDMSALDKKFTETEQKVTETRQFITNLNKAGTWFLRTIAVAALGVATSIAPSFIASHFTSSTPAATFAPFMYLTPNPSPMISPKRTLPNSNHP